MNAELSKDNNFEKGLHVKQHTTEGTVLDNISEEYKVVKRNELLFVWSIWSASSRYSRVLILKCFVIKK